MPTATKTYAETRRQKPFDWNKFLDLRRVHTDEEWGLAKTRAGHWTTCACGNQCSTIPREGPTRTANGVSGAPKDARLRTLGYHFYEEISGRDVLSAKATLMRIEARAAILIEEINAS